MNSHSFIFGALPAPNMQSSSAAPPALEQVPSSHLQLVPLDPIPSSAPVAIPSAAPSPLPLLPSTAPAPLPSQTPTLIRSHLEIIFKNGGTAKERTFEADFVTYADPAAVCKTLTLVLQQHRPNVTLDQCVFGYTKTKNGAPRTINRCNLAGVNIGEVHHFTLRQILDSRAPATAPVHVGTKEANKARQRDLNQKMKTAQAEIKSSLSEEQNAQLKKHRRIFTKWSYQMAKYGKSFMEIEGNLIEDLNSAVAAAQARQRSRRGIVGIEEPPLKKQKTDEDSFDSVMKVMQVVLLQQMLANMPAVKQVIKKEEKKDEDDDLDLV